MLITINDRVSYAISNRTYTDEGFLKVPGRVARTGVQEYLASELGLTDRAPTDIVRVMRPAEEVFKDESLLSYSFADITVEHPPGVVDASTFKDVSVGTVTTKGSQDGDFVTCDLIIKDKKAIAEIEKGKVELSAGYSAMYDNNVPDGADYEFIQRDIKINHVALVDRARAGAQARLFDSKHKETAMFKVTLGDGQTVEVADQATATLINSTVNALTKSVTDAKAEIDTLKAVNDVSVERIESLEVETSDEAIDKRVTVLLGVRDSARKIAGDDFTCDSLNVSDIQRAALSVKRSKIDWSDKSDVYVQAAFDQASEEDDEDENDKKKTSDTSSQYRQLATDAAGDTKNVVSLRDSSIDTMSNAWKKTAGEES